MNLPDKYWKFVIRTGNIYDPTGKKVWSGYSGGNCGKNLEGVNNPDMCGVKFIGPLPPGLFHFGNPVLQSHLGPFAIPLIPDSQTDMLGRDDVYCHGDRTDPKLVHCASEGCIIAPRYIRDMMWTSDCHDLVVIKE